MCNYQKCTKYEFCAFCAFCTVLRFCIFSDAETTDLREPLPHGAVGWSAAVSNCGIF